MLQRLAHGFQSLSFRHQQLIPILLINACFLTIASCIFLSTNIINDKKSLESLLLGKIKLIEPASISALLSGDKSVAKKIISSLSKNQQIDHAAIFDNNNQLFADLRHDDNLLHLQPLDQNVGFASTLSIYQPIRQDNKTLGYIYISAGQNLVHQPTKNYLTIILSALFVTFLLTYISLRYTQNLFTKPFDVLVSFARQVSTKPSCDRRITMTPPNELGELTNSFNNLLDRIQDRDKELIQTSLHIENIVAERTADLLLKANYDPLTKLANRNLLVEQLDSSLSEAKHYESKVTLMFLDLDRFKIINDNLGHSAGDKLLTQAAERLSNAVKNLGTVARWGGDEFVIIIKGSYQTNEIAATAKSIILSLEQPFPTDGNTLHISACIGISSYPEDGTQTSELIKHAGLGTYHAKKKGMGSFSFFQRDMKTLSMHRLGLESDLRKAIDNNELFLTYQPQYDIKSGSIFGVEALVRWRHPQRGIIMPNEFIPVAEEAGLIKKLGAWVLEEACRQNYLWQQQGLKPIQVAVNISASHITDPDFPAYVMQTLRRSQLLPQYLEIEITENLMVNITEEVFSILGQLRDFGVKIAIDDFGTGYSCLQYLCKFPVDTLKIDGSFVKGLFKGTAYDGVLASIVTLAHSLGMKVVAEWVEEAAHLKYLSLIECDLAQGFYLSPPLLPEEYAALSTTQTLDI